MNNEQLIGKKFDLDLGSLAPVSMIVKDVTKDKVIVEYLNSTPGMTVEFTISDFEYFAMIKIKRHE
jgi:FKBP-type peptidyl-prolyl cis-trans isomerase 2